MLLSTGTVVNGQIVGNGEPLPEGAIVTILARDTEEGFEVPAALEAELNESLQQADAGDTVSATEALARLRPRV